MLLGSAYMNDKLLLFNGAKLIDFNYHELNLDRKGLV